MVSEGSKKGGEGYGRTKRRVWVVHCVMLRAVLVGLVLLSLFDPPWVWAGSRFHERNHTGLLALYGFDDGQRSVDLHPTSARDYTGRYLMGNLSTSTSTISWSATRAGFTVVSPRGGPRVVSQQTSEALLAQLTAEVSIELFISSPTNPTIRDVFIAGFGDWPPGSPVLPCDSSASSFDGGWHLYSSDGDGIRIDVTVSNVDEPTCITVGFVTVGNALRHLVLRGRPGDVSLASHGTIDSAFDPSIRFEAEHWARHPSPLTFAVPQPTDGWTGSVYMFAVYNRFLTNTEVETNRLLGPPNSLAVAATSSLAFTEDVSSVLYP